MEIFLKKWSNSDKEGLISLCNSVNRDYLSDRLPVPYLDNDAKRWLNMVAQCEGKEGVFRAIVVNKQIVGSISVKCKTDVYRIDAELGYMLQTEWWNRGIVTEAVKKICEMAFQELDIKRITAKIFQPHIASQRVLQKNGFLHEGTLQSAVLKNGRIYGLSIYGLLNYCKYGQTK